MEENKVLQPEVEEIFYMRKKMSLKTREEMKEEMLANDEIEASDEVLEDYNDYLRKHGVTVLDNGYLWKGTYNNHYYATTEEINKDYCEYFLIGKAIPKFYFTLHLIEEFGINTLEDWEQYLEQNKDCTILSVVTGENELKESTLEHLLERVLDHPTPNIRYTQEDIDSNNKAIDAYLEEHPEVKDNPQCPKKYKDVDEFLESQKLKYGNNDLYVPTENCTEDPEGRPFVTTYFNFN